MQALGLPGEELDLPSVVGWHPRLELLRDVLRHLGVNSSAVYVAWYGEDESISRGVPIGKALDGPSSSCP